MTDKPIDPGPGWRLLEPGRLIHKAVECCRVSPNINGGLQRCSSWDPLTVRHGLRGGIVGKNWTFNGHCFRERIEHEPAASQWIPVAEKPLPESGQYLAQFADGTHEVWCSEYAKRDDIVAYQLIDPFVPPEPEKRAVYDKVQLLEHFNGIAIKTETWATGKGPTLVKYCDGDVDTDAAIRARERCEKVIHGLRENMYSQALAREILAILNGDDA